LIPAKRLQQIRERSLWDVFGDDGFAKCHEYGMRRPSEVAGVQLALPPIEEFQGARGSRNFVAEIVRPAAIRIDVVKMLVQLFGQEP